MSYSDTLYRYTIVLAPAAARCGTNSSTDTLTAERVGAGLTGYDCLKQFTETSAAKNLAERHADLLAVVICTSHPSIKTWAVRVRAVTKTALVF